ncbi:SIR2 family protein [Gymnodinialimonas sp.]
MPTFIGLTRYVIDFFDPPSDSEIMRAFQPWIDNPTASNMPLDQIFNLLHQEYGRDEVNSLVTERLTTGADAVDIGHHHDLIKRISSSPNGLPQVVTTNFDLLFETGEDTITHVPPAFPDLAFGTSIEGITYLHGRLAEVSAQHHSYVLSSAEFGRAYLSEAWATNFIRNLLDRYTVVLVGYQAEDPPIKYLLQGLNHDGQYDPSKLFAFDRGRPEDIEAKWRDRGVTAIAYEDHSNLWETIEAWADRSTDPRAWRSSVIQLGQQDPKSLMPYQRGQVAHVLRSVPGAKAFAEAEPPSNPEWLCVLDAGIRSAEEAKGYGDNAEVFDPKQMYGLDDDRHDLTDEDYRNGITNDHLMVWRYDDENPADQHRLGGRQPEGSERVPPRLWHLIVWVGKNIHDPIVAWWACRQHGLHPRLLSHIEWQMAQRDDLHESARTALNLIVEHHKDPRNRQWDGDWFDLQKRISNEGWTTSVLRDFRRVCSPRIAIKRPYSLGGVRPPSKDWPDLRLEDMGRFEVQFLERHNEELAVPDDALPRVIDILADQLLAASGMLSDIGATYFITPTCYPGREVDGNDRYSDAAEAMAFFIELFNRLQVLHPALARGHAGTWPFADKFFFRKLRLFALSKPALFSADDVAETVLSLDDEVFWDTDVSRELLFLLVDRWASFSQAQQTLIGTKILEGPDQEEHWSAEDYPRFKSELVGRYGRYLELQGCSLTYDLSEKLARVVSGIENWSDGWATSTVTERGSHVGWVGTDETPDVIMNLPINEIVTRATADLQRDFDSFTEKRPFTGLVKTNPRKALSALTVAAKRNEYPQAFWAALIDHMPRDIDPRLRRVFLHRVSRLPHRVVAELRHSLGSWLEKGLGELLEFDDWLGWFVFDHIANGFFAWGNDVAESDLGEVLRGGKAVKKSRRTVGHAIVGPVGMMAAALLDVALSEQQEAGSLVPDNIKTRLERLFAAPGEGSDHTTCIVMRQLNRLMQMDPHWTEKRLLPMLVFEHPASEPSWNGFLHAGRNPSSALAEQLKPLLLTVFPWVEQQAWDRDLSKVAANWLCWMCIFRQDKPDGLTKKEMRNTLRSMSDETRNRVIFWLGMVGQKNDNGWADLVTPFIRDVWPRERAFRTSSSVGSWISMLDDTGDSLPMVYAEVKRFLVPVETDRHPFYRFTRALEDQEPLTKRFPETTLDLVHTVTPTVLTRPPYELPDILSIIAEVQPEIVSDHRYLRLIDLVERS